MKKMIFALLLLLLAVPVMASTVTITVDAQQNGYAAIKYTSDATVRAFALNVTVSTGTITEVTDYKTDGESVTGSQGYGIFLDPVTGIDINDGVVDAYGSPVADACSPGAAGSGIGTNKVVLGLGALYEDGNQPGNSGTLCRIRVSAQCTVTVTAESTYRGGVVMTDGNPPATLTLTGATNVAVGAPDECFPIDTAGRALWVELSKPVCWCYKRNCYGDADNLAQGNTSTGYYYVGSNDLGLLIPAYNVKQPPQGPGISAAQQCANFAHDVQGNTSTGYYYVGSNDLGRLIPTYLDKEPPVGDGIATDCMD